MGHISASEKDDVHMSHLNLASTYMACDAATQVEPLQAGGGAGAHEGVGVVVEEDHDAAGKRDEHGAAARLGKADDRVCEALRPAAALDEPRQARQEPREEDDKDVVFAGKRLDDVRVERPQEAPEGVVPAPQSLARDSGVLPSQQAAMTVWCRRQSQ